MEEEGEKRNQKNERGEGRRGCGRKRRIEEGRWTRKGEGRGHFVPLERQGVEEKEEEEEGGTTGRGREKGVKRKEKKEKKGGKKIAGPRRKREEKIGQPPGRSVDGEAARGGVR